LMSEPLMSVRDELAERSVRTIEPSSVRWLKTPSPAAREGLESVRLELHD